MATASSRRRPSNPPRTHNKQPAIVAPLLENDPNGDVADALRRVRALQLRAEGYTYEAIAREAGYSGKSAAYNAVKYELRKTRVEAVRDLRIIENMRLERMWRIVSEALDEGGDSALWAIDRGIDISARRSKLNGLDITRDEIMSAMPYQKRILLDESEPSQGLLPTPEVSPRQLAAGPVILSDEEPGL